MTLDDMANYKVVIRPVHNVTYRGLTLHGIGSPAGGAVSLQILKIMERYDSKDWSDQDLSPKPCASRTLPESASAIQSL